MYIVWQTYQISADFIKLWSYVTTGVYYTLKFYTHATVVIS